MQKAHKLSGKSPITDSTHLLFLSGHVLVTKWAQLPVLVPANGRIVVRMCVIGFAPAPGILPVDIAARAKVWHEQWL